MRGFVIFVVLLAAGVTAAISLLTSTFPASAPATEDLPRLGYNLALLFVVGSSIIVSFRKEFAQSVRSLAIWTAIFFGLILVYSYRNDAQAILARVGAELTPSIGIETGPKEIAFRRGTNGHFAVTGHVNGADVLFIVDTGATSVALTLNDAVRAGINQDALVFDQPISTANGTAVGARLRLSQIAIGPIVLNDVEATVMRDGLDQSLLGMSFLNALEGYAFSNDTLTMTGK